MDTPETKIRYSCVAHGTVILCSHQVGTVSLKAEAQLILEDVLKDSAPKVTFSKNRYWYYCLKEDDLVYMCVAEEEISQPDIYAYLAEVKECFQCSPCATKSCEAKEHEFQDKFSPSFIGCMEKFSKPSNNNVQALKSQVKQVKVIMVENIEKFSERGENLKILIEKSEALVPASSAFKKITKKSTTKNVVEECEDPCNNAVGVFDVSSTATIQPFSTVTMPSTTMATQTSTTPTKPTPPILPVTMPTEPTRMSVTTVTTVPILTSMSVQGTTTIK
ncbi:hypothetical protein ScPMuIL_003601 [Solemya velum]